MDEHKNAALTRSGFDAFAKGDMARLGELFAEDAVWHTAGKGPLAGDRVGREAIFSYFGALMERSGGTFHNEVTDILASEERSVALTTTKAERNGNTLAADAFIVFRVKDDLVTEVWSAFFDQDSADVFWND